MTYLKRALTLSCSLILITAFTTPSYSAPKESETAQKARLANEKMIEQIEKNKRASAEKTRLAREKMKADQRKADNTIKGGKRGPY